MRKKNNFDMKTKHYRKTRRWFFHPRIILDTKCDATAQINIIQQQLEPTYLENPQWTLYTGNTLK